MAFGVQTGGFRATHHRTRRIVPNCCARNGAQITRREALALFCSTAAATLIPAPAKTIAAEPTEERNDTPPTTTGFMTKTGLKYVDFEVGTGDSPTWGDYVRIHYVAYTISPDGLALQKEESTYGRNENSGYLIHHGNGEMILGLEEAIHSMQVGGRRRAIIPPLLAYIDTDLGPVPPAAWDRRRFSKHLKQTDGSVVFDIELLSVTPDPDNRGYYDDLQLTEEEEMEMAKASRVEYAEQLRAKGITPPDPNQPSAPYLLGEERAFPYSPYVTPGLPRPDTPKKDFSLVY